MVISKEKVCGWLVEYGRGEVGQHPGWVVELEVVPAVWEMYVLEHPDKFDTSDPYCFFAWKRELSLKEKRILKRNADSLTRQIKEVQEDFTQFQEDYLDLWNDFCAEYQRLTPEQIQTAKKFCVLDSVTTLAAPSAPVEYVLDFAVQNKSGNVWPGVAILGPLSSPSGFLEALETNNSLREIIKRSLGKNASGGFEHVEIQERGKYFEQHPERRFNTQNIPELADFVKAYNAGGSQAAPASGSFLVCSDSAPADPLAVPAGFVPVLIQGKYTEIQDAVRDSKRKTTLTEQEKTNTKLDCIGEKIVLLDEKIERLVGVNEQTAQNTAETARIAGTIAENTQGLKGVNLKPVEEAEKKSIVFEEAKTHKGTEKAYAISALIYGKPNEIQEVWKIGNPDLDPKTDYDDSERRRVKKGMKKGAGKLADELNEMAGNQKKDSDC